jgi:hypothetical protein
MISASKIMQELALPQSIIQLIQGVLKNCPTLDFWKFKKIPHLTITHNHNCARKELASNSLRKLTKWFKIAMSDEKSSDQLINAIIGMI